MISILLLAACAPPPPSPDTFETLAASWVGAGGSVRGCDYSGCDVVTAAGCEVRLECGFDEMNQEFYCTRNTRSPVGCPGGEP